MRKIFGYEVIDELYKSQKIRVLRVRNTYSNTFIMKTHCNQYPSIEDIDRLKHEYLITKKLNIKGIISPKEIISENNSFFLVKEDFKSITLKEYLYKNKLSIHAFLDICIQLSSIIEDLHEASIIHKDINPSNILINPETLEVRITDFSISTTYKKEHRESLTYGYLEGTPAYMAPEQTGRINRFIDYRSDLYSLGISMYEMLTGQLPFVSDDIFEQVYQHISCLSKSPHDIDKTIPKILSSIVMKLIEKNSEDRYQSSAGLKDDLEKCLKRLSGKRQIKDFQLAELDKSSQFIVPEKLYGRDQEIQQIIQCFQKSCSGSTEVVLISGYSGVGKTSIMAEINKYIFQSKGHFVSGKYNKIVNNTPYSALIDALKTRIQQILTESPDKLESWKNIFFEKIPQNRKILIDFIPEIELIIGKQNSIANLETIASKNRFNITFNKFFSALFSNDTPLVIFLDDLQWADAASINFICNLIAEETNKKLLLIGAYRNNEVNEIHPVKNIVKSNSERLTQIRLQPLDKKDIQKIVCESLKREDSSSIELSNFLYKKTDGNPFYLKQILLALEQEKFFVFNNKTLVWEWNFSELSNIEVNKHSVIDLLASNLQKLPNQTLDILKLASCIGNTFSLNDITQLYLYSFEKVALALRPALEENFIIIKDSLLKKSTSFNITSINNLYSLNLSNSSNQTSDNYLCQFVFLHDSVHQAIYSLIPKKTKEKIHLSIARKTAKKLADNHEESIFFQIANHYNLGIESVTSLDEKDEIIRFNICASKNAKKSNAYEISRDFLRNCLKIIEYYSWDYNYKILLDFYTELLEVEYLCTNYSKADEISNLVISKTTDLLDKIKIYEIKIQYYIAENKMKAAIDCIFPFLQELGIYIPLKTNKARLILELTLIRSKFWNKSIISLKDLPVMQDPYTLGAMRILSKIVPAIFISKPEIFPLVIFKMVDLSLKFGNSSESSFAYSSYGVILCGLSINVETGYRMGSLALDLLHDLDCHEQTSKIFVVVNAFIKHWKEPLHQIIDSWEEGIQKGLETGDIENACHCAAFCSSQIFLSGTNLELAHEKLLKYYELTIKYRQKLDTIHIGLWLQVIDNLLFLNHNNELISGDYFDENILIPELIESNNRLIVFPAFLGKIMLAYIYKNYSDAFDLLTEAIQYIDSALSLVYEPIFIFYQSLILCQLLKNKRVENKYFNVLAKNRKKLKNYAVVSPGNYLGKYSLVEAEYCHLLEKKWEAIEYYQVAIDTSKKNNQLLELAIANERFSEYFLFNRMSIPARSVMRSSMYAYIGWGALLKVKHLQDLYAESFDESVFIENTKILNLVSDNTNTKKYEYDLSTVLQASQAISEEIVLESLLEKLMHVLIESANSQLGILVLNRNNEFFVEAVLDYSLESIVFPQVELADYQSYIPLSIVNYVTRTHEDIVINNILDCELDFLENIKSLDQKNKSILCLPIFNQSQLIGVLYLENNLVNDAYRNDHVEILKLLCSQVAISLKNAYLYDDLQKTKAREQAEREINELKSRFISMTSHEFRTPLTAILGTTELIKHYGQGWETEKQHSYLDRIQRNVKHMTGLLDDVLVLSKADVGKTEFNPVSIDLTVFCSSLVEEFQLNTKRGQNIEYVLEGKQTTCFSDEKILRQILSNLLSNAIKYSPESSIVCFTVTFSNDEVVFLIKDQGIGIPESDQPHLFESFQRATNVGQIQGTGLGLAIVKKSVELHQGTITFESTASQGTTFIVRLPITAESLGIESH